MKFSKVQLNNLFVRLRQTKEELLFDHNLGEVGRDWLKQDGASILGVAHCDYVEDAWSYPVYRGKHKVQAGQVDDRVGVWLLLNVLPYMAGMPKFDVLLTTDEEIGRSSAQEVLEDLDYNWVFQFDRRGTDFVDYDLASDEFVEDFKQATGIPYGHGSFSDICYLPDSCGSRVNIGTGYHNEHSPNAHVNLIECGDQVKRFVKFASQFASKAYPCAGLPRGGRKGYSERWYDYKSLSAEYTPDDDIPDFDTWQ